MIHDDSFPTDSPVENLRRCSREIKAALDETSAAERRVEIVAVSKKQPAELVRRALEGGHRLFGENRVQEAKAKWPSLKADFPDLKLHLIGPLQSNKAADAVALFDVIETLDRPKIARVLAEEMRRQGRNPVLLAQVNTGEEPQKAGIAPGDIDGFLGMCRDEYGLRIDGVMCIPPAHEPPAPHFALLKKIADRHTLKIISMGMSADYPIAAQLGATHVRIGSAVFGERAA